MSHTITMNNNFDEEMLQEFKAISNVSKRQSNCTVQHVFDVLCLKEFHCFGLPSLDDLLPYKRSMILQLIDNVHSLIQMHRKLIAEKNAIDLKNTNCIKEINTLNASISNKYNLW